MLVLTRKVNESICIGDDIVVKVVRIQGNRIQFGIEAPKEVRIVRGELQAATPLITATAGFAPTLTTPTGSPTTVPPGSDAIS